MIDLHFELGIIPVVVQEQGTGTVLMVAYASREAVDLTRTTGFAHYYSRSRQKLWKKGEESGHLQRVHRVLVDCDSDCLLYEVDQVGAACHMGYHSCFFRTLHGEEIMEKSFDPGRVYANKDQ